MYSLLLTQILACTDDDGVDETPMDPPKLDLVTKNDSGVFVHLFEWTWNDIARECVDFLGPAGYQGVQISPPNEHALVDGSTWWQRYQPVSYIIESRSGSREELAQMVQTCNEAGVAIYADAVINHMTGAPDEATDLFGSAGSPYTHYSYPDWNTEDFHMNCPDTSGDISNYQNAFEVRNCELVNLADLKTEEDRVRQRIAEYLADLVSLGIDGFRIDAAKHMNPEDVFAIIDKTNEISGEQPYYFLEVIASPDEPITLEEYAGTKGDVTDFNFAGTISQAFKSNNLSILDNRLYKLEEHGAVVFVDNHDTQRKDYSLSFKEPESYKLANIVMLAWNYGLPKIMSSYDFDSFNDGPPSDANGVTQSVDCNAGWACEHRWPEIVKMVAFRKFLGDEPLDIVEKDNSTIVFTRGDKALIAVNNGSQDKTINIASSLADGQYCNILSDSCESPIGITSGQGSITIPKKSALVLASGYETE